MGRGRWRGRDFRRRRLPGRLFTRWAAGIAERSTGRTGAIFMRGGARCARGAWRGRRCGRLLRDCSADGFGDGRGPADRGFCSKPFHSQGFGVNALLLLRVILLERIPLKRLEWQSAPRNGGAGEEGRLVVTARAFAPAFGRGVSRPCRKGASGMGHPAAGGSARGPGACRCRGECRRWGLRGVPPEMGCGRRIAVGDWFDFY